MINDYRNAIREHIRKKLAAGDLANLIVWDVQTDEANDPTLLSSRAYSSRNYADAVIVAAGASGIWEPLGLNRIALPTLINLIQLEQEYK